MASTGGFSVGWFMLIMLISGALNTILMKFMVMQKVPTGAGASAEGFDQPYFQTLLMMVGEFLCLIAYYATRGRDTNLDFAAVPKSIFAVACGFDWTATTLVNMAYVCIPASVVHMTRGAIVIFTCILSMTFLGRRQHKYHLAGVAFVAIGITLVSLSTFINPAVTASVNTASASTSLKLFGISLCLVAQIFQASMLVYEEKIMGKYTVPPLLVVGMEGTFGIIFGLILLTALNALHIENTPGAIYQISHSKPLLFAVIGSIFSIAFFNFSGVTVTQKASAVARSTIDVSRTIIIWAVELGMGWNSFNLLQFVGFVAVAMGTMMYNRIITFSFLDALDAGELAAILKNKTLDVETAIAQEDNVKAKQ